MNLLAVDTSSRRLSLAVKTADGKIRQRNVILTRVLESSMIPAVRRILDGSGLSLDKLDALAVGLGPGSFTSLRVGLATMKGLAFAAGKPLIGIPSLDALVLGCAGLEAAQICTVGDAKRNMVYGCVYDVKDGGAARRSEYLLIEMKILLTRIKNDTVFAGDGADLYKDLILAHGKKIRRRMIFAGDKSAYPQARHVLELAEEIAAKGKFSAPEQIAPLYLYPDDCQVSPKPSKGKQ